MHEGTTNVVVWNAIERLSRHIEIWNSLLDCFSVFFYFFDFIPHYFAINSIKM